MIPHTKTKCLRRQEHIVNKYLFRIAAYLQTWRKITNFNWSKKYFPISFIVSFEFIALPLTYRVSFLNICSRGKFSRNRLLPIFNHTILTIILPSTGRKEQNKKQKTTTPILHSEQHRTKRICTQWCKRAVLKNPIICTRARPERVLCRGCFCSWCTFNTRLSITISGWFFFLLLVWSPLSFSGCFYALPPSAHWTTVAGHHSSRASETLALWHRVFFFLSPPSVERFVLERSSPNPHSCRGREWFSRGSRPCILWVRITAKLSATAFASFSPSPITGTTSCGVAFKRNINKRFRRNASAASLHRVSFAKARALTHTHTHTSKRASLLDPFYMSESCHKLTINKKAITAPAW